jgi:hypothetical protein
MSTFVCEKCGCVDNSACGGTYHTKNCDWWPEEYRGKALCCVCASPKFKDGSINTGAGKWHNKFPRLTEEEWKNQAEKEG